MNKSLKEEVKRIIGELKGIKEELEEKFDNASESWQGSDKGDECLTAIGNISDAVEYLEELT